LDYNNRNQIIHKLKDSDINNPFRKNNKINTNLNSLNHNNIYNNDININSNQFQSTGSSKIRNGGNKIMRVIRGGNGASKNEGNHFFSKMLNYNNNRDSNPLFTSFDPNLRNSLKNTNNKSKKINIDKLQREKFEQELRMLDCDDLNNSGDSEYRMELVSNSNRDNYLNNKNVNNNISNNINPNNNTNSKFKFENDILSNRVKTPDKNTRSSIWNIFS